LESGGQRSLLRFHHNDLGKQDILTQSPMIERGSQRLIIALAPSLIQMGESVQELDISQAYPQSKTDLCRTILAYLPKELETK
jgi:hypothetical protein